MHYYSTFQHFLLTPTVKNKVIQNSLEYIENKIVIEKYFKWNIFNQKRFLFLTNFYLVKLIHFKSYSRFIKFVSFKNISVH